MKKEGEKKWER